MVLEKLGGSSCDRATIGDMSEPEGGFFVQIERDPTSDQLSDASHVASVMWSKVRSQEELQQMNAATRFHVHT